jgi:hypothetical protein
VEAIARELQELDCGRLWAQASVIPYMVIENIPYDHRGISIIHQGQIGGDYGVAVSYSARLEAAINKPA